MRILKGTFCGAPGFQSYVCPVRARQQVRVCCCAVCHCRNLCNQPNLWPTSNKCLRFHRPPLYSLIMSHPCGCIGRMGEVMFPLALGGRKSAASPYLPSLSQMRSATLLATDSNRPPHPPLLRPRSGFSFQCLTPSLPPSLALPRERLISLVSRLDQQPYCLTPDVMLTPTASPLPPEDDEEPFALFSGTPPCPNTRACPLPPDSPHSMLQK